MYSASLNKLTVTKCVIGNASLTGIQWFDGLNSPNTVLNVGSVGSLVVMPGIITPSNKYYMYCLNDTTTTRKAHYVRVNIDITYSDSSTESITLTLPANTPVRTFIPAKSLQIPTGQTISSIAVTGFAPTAGTIADMYVEFDYTK